MAEPRELRDEFAAAYEAGEGPNPRDFVERASAEDRQETEALIDRYLMTAPRRKWDPVAYEHSLAKVAVDQVLESMEGVSGTWPELLPSLRKRARIMRRDLVERLARTLGFGEERQVEKIERYYNGMEHGLVPAAGVSARVIDALAGILGADAERIRQAGSRGQASPGEVDAVYARLAVADEAYADADAPAATPAERAPEQPDEIDRLFTGG
jgi:hypothetical protein